MEYVPQRRPKRETLKESLPHFLPRADNIPKSHSVIAIGKIQSHQFVACSRRSDSRAGRKIDEEKKVSLRFSLRFPHVRFTRSPPYLNFALYYLNASNRLISLRKVDSVNSQTLYSYRWDRRPTGFLHYLEHTGRALSTSQLCLSCPILIRLRAVSLFSVVRRVHSPY